MDHSVTLKDTDQRIHYTLESIEKWLSHGNDIRLVICDGSGYDFSGILKERFPARRIECLSFENDSRLVEQHGKGYGEGEIISYALQHSTHLRQSNSFAKCTAKLWVDNFLECSKEWNGFFLCRAFFSNVFSFKKTNFEYVDTRFYLSGRDVYFKYFSKTHLKVGGAYGTSIEDNFKAIILENRLQHLLFRSPPVVRGVGGASGKYYRDNRIRRIKEILRSKIVQSNPEFSDLFNRVR
jgi:hypothetical protein